MKVLLIEDEEHKAEDLTRRLLKTGLAASELTRAIGVRQAVLEVMKGAYDLIIVDMALPTFSSTGDDGSGGGGQAVGGIEILRALSSTKVSTKVIIVTQYPDIIVGGERVRLHQAARVLSAKYRQEVLGAVLYSYKTPEWEAAFDALLGKLKWQ
ncbi:response regulator [Bradyrhizobium sp. URHA0013]|uniref:response regulator n=1 Tax=Bradyrhizobium sp. URHA0013 TaxID=1380352 RepID=UPI00047F8FFA|nr:response regulator [Bradyrhizobium sp. URHA0013]